MNDSPPLLLYPGPRNALLRRFAALTSDELHALEAAVLAHRTERRAKGRIDRGFWFAWMDATRLRREEREQMDELFAAVMVAVATGLTGLDVERFGARLAGSQGSGGIAGVFSFLKPSRPTKRGRRWRSG